MAEAVVVGVDGSSASSAALRWAARYAERIGAELRVVHVWDIPPGWARADLVTPDIVQDLERLASETVADAVDAAHAREPALDLRGDVLRGSPVRRLIDVSRTAELLVVGNVGHSPLSGLLLGSVADSLVRHASCPVAVIPLGR